MKSIWVKLIFLLFLGYNLVLCQKEIDSRYNGGRNDYFRENFQGLVDLKPKLREIGISRLDTVIVMGDVTINGSLYMLDQKGWSNYGGYMSNEDSVKIDRSIAHGAKYMILLDSVWQEKEFIKPYIKNKIFQH